MTRHDAPWRDVTAQRKHDRRRPGRDTARSTRQQPQKKRKPRRSPWRFVKYAFAALLAAALGLAGLVAYYAAGLPATDSLFASQGTPSVTMLDRGGRVIVTRGAGVGEILPVEQMSPYLPKAVLAIEDRRFYDHFGLDIWGLGRAAYANFEAGRVVQGGSTITQQLAKNLFLTPDRTFERKMEEALLAIWLEMKFTKDEILTLYLNRVYFGAGTYGVDAAARRYFNKSARDVTLKEAAILAGLLKAPSRLAPTSNAKAAEERAQLVLAAMLDAGFITTKERAAAGDAETRVMARSSAGADYFVDWTMEQVPALIGGEPQGDIVVETTLDLDMQRAAESAVAKALAEGGQKLRVGQAAMAALGLDGGVRAMVGGRSYAESQFNRATQAMRSPGSSFKPFVFLAALESGYTPDSRVMDAPIKLKNWNPGNYKHAYEGEVTLTRALSRSLNSVAIRLIVDVGAERAISVARRMGVLSPLTAQPSLALGTSEVNLLEITGAYAPFANGGFSAMPHGILRIRTREGETLYERSGSGPMQVIPPVFAAEMTLMMRETVNAGTARRARLKDRDAAGKTGTGQGSRDAWFIGYTRDLVAGVWVGNDDYAPMKGVTGGAMPAQIWAAFMGAVSDRSEAGPLIALENAPSVEVAAGAGWYEDGASQGGGGNDGAPAGTVPVEQAPVDGPPMETPQAESGDFDAMFEEMFGEERPPERQDRPGA